MYWCHAARHQFPDAIVLMSTFKVELPFGSTTCFSNQDSSFDCCSSRPFSLQNLSTASASSSVEDTLRVAFLSSASRISASTSSSEPGFATAFAAGLVAGLTAGLAAPFAAALAFAGVSAAFEPFPNPFWGVPFTSIFPLEVSFPFPLEAQGSLAGSAQGSSISLPLDFPLPSSPHLADLRIVMHGLVMGSPLLSMYSLILGSSSNRDREKWPKTVSLSSFRSLARH
mmetsp:Transcript_79316/g.161298  ORF Transcript_79316/g.161298 Transcript_79316/m.161298 type:complete len:227 (-) Transcript_79316:704-1384(-)